MRRGTALVLALALTTVLAGCGSSGEDDDPADAVPAKICGLFDRDRIVALDIPVEDIRSRGQVADRETRLDDPITCTVRDTRRDATVVTVEVADLEPDEIAARTADLADEYDERGIECSQPEAISAIGDGYACDVDGRISVDVVVPGRLVRLDYAPIRTEPQATAYARAIGLISNLQENVVAYDQANPSESPSSS